MGDKGHVSGVLFLAATPIGNVADASPHLVSLLETADIIAAEDSRRAVRLLRDLSISAPGKIISFYDSVEEAKANQLIADLKSGLNVLVISDAGMPTVSDPGFRLVHQAIAQNIKVQVVPGPSAVLAALAISGLPTDRFTFEGFLNRKTGSREKQLVALKFESRTMIFFEAPHRLAETISAMKKVFGEERRAVICRELTKTHEEVVRGTFAELQQWCDREILGEITLVVAGASEIEESTPDQWVELVANRVSLGLSTKDAVAEVAQELNVPKREVYDAVISAAQKSK
ncbi:MAG: 16S rRNA (cytidine(1402)-2'-O)-methyltransferase [Actinomycetales bacterium]|nr:16S rRNA (cytidine(1402)-2'-O)-methyltransferase [Actinomycetales bacterium]